MPFKRHYGRRAKPRRGRRRMKPGYRWKKKSKLFNNKRPVLKYNGPGRAPLPDMYMTKITYQDWINAASGGVSGVQDFVFSGNSAYDPYTGVANPGCAAFTELAAIYTNYRVYGSKITVLAKTISDSTATGDCVCLLVPDRSSTSYTMATTISRQAIPYAKMVMLNRLAAGDTPTLIKNFRKTKHMFGETDIDDDVYTSATTTSPASQWYWHLVFARGDQSSISAYPGVQFLLKITYFIRFERRRALSAP